MRSSLHGTVESGLSDLVKFFDMHATGSCTGAIRCRTQLHSDSVKTDTYILTLAPKADIAELNTGHWRPRPLEQKLKGFSTLGRQQACLPASEVKSDTTRAAHQHKPPRGLGSSACCAALRRSGHGLAQAARIECGSRRRPRRAGRQQAPSAAGAFKRAYTPTSIHYAC